MFKKGRVTHTNRFQCLSYCKETENEIVFTFCFAKPGSITNTTPSIVNDVSAILVDTTTCRKIK